VNGTLDRDEFKSVKEYRACEVLKLTKGEAVHTLEPGCRQSMKRGSMRITIDIPDELHARLKAFAKNEGATMRAIVLSAIDRLLRENKAEPHSASELPVL
jgi:hypothetical protein